MDVESGNKEPEMAKDGQTMGIVSEEDIAAFKADFIEKMKSTYPPGSEARLASRAEECANVFRNIVTSVLSGAEKRF